MRRGSMQIMKIKLRLVLKAEVMRAMDSLQEI